MPKSFERRLEFIKFGIGSYGSERKNHLLPGTFHLKRNQRMVRLLQNGMYLSLLLFLAGCDVDVSHKTLPTDPSLKEYANCVSTRANMEAALSLKALYLYEAEENPGYTLNGENLPSRDAYNLEELSHKFEACEPRLRKREGENYRELVDVYSIVKE